jgi:hypothetical protein
MPRTTTSIRPRRTTSTPCWIISTTPDEQRAKRQHVDLQSGRTAGTASSAGPPVHRFFDWNSGRGGLRRRPPRKEARSTAGQIRARRGGGPVGVRAVPTELRWKTSPSSPSPLPAASACRASRASFRPLDRTGGTFEDAGGSAAPSSSRRGRMRCRGRSGWGRAGLWTAGASTAPCRVAKRSSLSGPCGSDWSGRCGCPNGAPARMTAIQITSQLRLRPARTACSRTGTLRDLQRRWTVAATAGPATRRGWQWFGPASIRMRACSWLWRRTAMHPLIPAAPASDDRATTRAGPDAACWPLRCRSVGESV